MGRFIRIKLSVLPKETEGPAVLLHEAIIEDTYSIWEVAMDSDYTLFLYNRIGSLYSEIQIRNTCTFQVLNTIVLDDSRTDSTFRPYVFHYLNGLIATCLRTEMNNEKWIRFNLNHKFIFERN